MTLPKALFTITLLLPLAGLADAPNASAQAVAPEPEVLARGPLHEAFAQPPEGTPQAGPIVSRQPPNPVEELPPDQKPPGDNVQWIPGYWQWDDERADFIWVSGTWRTPPPGRQWLPGSWRQVEGGWQWVSGLWAPAEQSDLTYQPPPPPSVEVGPSAPAPGDDYFYDPGCWIYRAANYLWRPGCWRGYRPDLVWSPCRYAWTPAGCVFVNGYWDYPLAQRGLLFAPAYFSPDVLSNWNGSWTPRYVVGADVLPGALFVGHGGGHYYFGDYYGPRYQRAGYMPWFDGVGRGAVDPLFASTRRSYGGSGWERNLRGFYAARGNGQLALPPRTLGQQTAAIDGLRQRSNSGQLIRNATMLTSLGQVPRLAPVGGAERLRQLQGANQFRGVAQQRTNVERNLARGQGAPGRPGAAPQSVRLNLPGQGGTRLRPGSPGSLGFRPAQPRSGRPLNPDRQTAARGTAQGTPRRQASLPQVPRRGGTPSLRPGRQTPQRAAPQTFAPQRAQAPQRSAPGQVRAPAYQRPRAQPAPARRYQAPAPRPHQAPAQHYQAPRPQQSHRAAPSAGHAPARSSGGRRGR